LIENSFLIYETVLSISRSSFIIIFFSNEIEELIYTAVNARREVTKCQSGQLKLNIKNLAVGREAVAAALHRLQLDLPKMVVRANMLITIQR